MAFALLRPALACAILAVHSLYADVTPRSVSSSRQFIVFGGDAALRGVAGDAAERVKADLLRVLQAPDRWSVPILLYMQEPRANVPELPRVQLHFSQTGAGLKIQLDLLIANDFDAEVFRRETMRALILEMAYRQLPSLPAGQLYIAPPDWLVEGLVAYGSNANGEQPLAEPVSLAELLKQNFSLLDSPSRALYRASAGLLLRLLATSEAGPSRLCRFIADLPQATNDPFPELCQHFPQLGGSTAEVEKTWTQFAGNISSGPDLSAFSSTNEQLDELLRTAVARSADGRQQFTLTQAIAVARPRLDGRAAADLDQRLMLLSAVAHPLLRPVVLQYQQALEALRAGKRRGIERRGAAAAALRVRLSTRMLQVEDYMNWFEATQARSSSRAFRDYAAAAQNTETVPRRRDPVSVYLDAMEAQIR